MNPVVNNGISTANLNWVARFLNHQQYELRSLLLDLIPRHSPRHGRPGFSSAEVPPCMLWTMISAPAWTAMAFHRTCGVAGNVYRCCFSWKMSCFRKGDGRKNRNCSPSRFKSSQEMIFQTSIRKRILLSEFESLTKKQHFFPTT